MVSDSRHIARHVTVYASDIDLALDASYRVHRDDFRAGDSRAGLNIPDVDVVGVSAVSLSDPLGHSYYGSHPKVLDQIQRLIRQTKPVVATPVGMTPTTRI